jgi:hypothetical protein
MRAPAVKSPQFHGRSTHAAGAVLSSAKRTAEAATSAACEPAIPPPSWPVVVSPCDVPRRPTFYPCGAWRQHPILCARRNAGRLQGRAAPSATPVIHWIPGPAPSGAHQLRSQSDVRIEEAVTASVPRPLAGRRGRHSARRRSGACARARQCRCAGRDHVRQTGAQTTD